MIVLRNATAQVKIDPDLGGALLSYQTRHNTKIYNWLRDGVTARHPVAAACFTMAPYCSRIAEGQFRYNQRAFHTAPPSGLADKRQFPHALHGSAWLNAWQSEDVTKSHCVLSYTEQANAHTPFVFQICQAIHLTVDQLQIRLTLRNLGPERMPFGLGLHPYFPIIGDTRIRARVDKIWLTQDDMPTVLVRNATCRQLARGLRPAQIRLDNTFVNWDGHLQIDNSLGTLVVTADNLRQLCLFTPNAQFFCAEPVSNPANALNMMHLDPSAHGLHILAPGEHMQARVCFRPQADLTRSK